MASLILYERGGFYWVSGTLKDPAGGRSTKLRKSTGFRIATSPRKVAEDYVRGIEKKFYNGGLDAVAQEALTFGPLAREYREARVNECGHLGITSDNALTKLEQAWETKPVEEINSAAVQTLAKELYPPRATANGRGANWQTWNRQVVGVVSTVLKTAAANSRINAVPVLKKFGKPRGVVEKKKTPVTKAWAQAFVANTPADKPQLRALALYLFQTGSRITDAVELTWGQVYLGDPKLWGTSESEATATFLIGKTDVDHTPKLPVETCEALAALPGSRQPGERVFGYSSRQGPRYGWDKVCKKLVSLGFKKLSYHCCRHGFATDLAEQGVPAHEIAEAGGWLNIALVQKVYCRPRQDRTVSDKLSWRKKAA